MREGLEREGSLQPLLKTKTAVERIRGFFFLTNRAPILQQLAIDLTTILLWQRIDQFDPARILGEQFVL